VTSCPAHSRHVLNGTPTQTASQLNPRRLPPSRCTTEPPPREAVVKIHPPAVKKVLRQASPREQPRSNGACVDSQLSLSLAASVSVLREGPKRLFVGRPMRSSQLSETLLPKKLAMPVFCSDPLSSVAYATEEILLILSLAGLAFLHLAWYVAAVIVALLAVVIASYRQTCRAYPNGGGAYTVARANLGESAGLAAASALLVDYVLTVAVSVVAGVAAITSAVPELSRHAVSMSVGFVVLLTVMNLRGVKESGTAFAVPTYGFLLGIYVMFAVAAYRLLSGEHLLAPTAGLPIQPEHSYVGIAVVLLAMRAFASGCTALTGVEAISNGVPAFQKPKAKTPPTPWPSWASSRSPCSSA
jgi:hypothetical protein